MGGFLSLYGGTERVEVARDGEKVYWVEIRKSLSQMAFSQVQRALVKPTLIDDTVSGETHTGAYQIEWVAQSVTDWNLTDENDQPLPLGGDKTDPVAVSRKSVASLPAAVVVYLYKKCHALHDASTEEVSNASFRDGGDGRDQDRERPAPAAEPVLDGQGVVAAAWADRP